jgi:hypothetical protein
LSTSPARAGLLATLALIVSACDDGTRVNRVENSASANGFFVTAGAAGVPVEVHGRPFAAVTSAEAVARLKPAPGMAQDITFRSVAPGALADDYRLLLVFNRRDVVDSIRDCRRSAEGQPIPVDPAPDDAAGFTLTASICNARNRIATANLEATTTPADDPAEFQRVMQNLLRILTDTPS